MRVVVPTSSRPPRSAFGGDAVTPVWQRWHALVSGLFYRVGGVKGRSFTESSLMDEPVNSNVISIGGLSGQQRAVVREKPGWVSTTRLSFDLTSL